MGRLSGASTTSQPTGTGGRISGGRLSRGTNTTLATGGASLRSTAGLESLAEERGVDVSRVPKQGEDPSEIFSGGVFMDTMDTLNALQYGVTGLLKGKSFSEGVRTRQSFSDKDSIGQYGIPGVVAGIAADIAVDPLTYLGGLGILKRAVVGTGKGISYLGKQLAKNSDVARIAGDEIGKRFIYRYGQDPIYKEMAERHFKNSNLSIQNVVELNKVWKKLDGNTQKAIAEARKTGKAFGAIKDPTVKAITKIDGLTDDMVKNVNDVFSEADRLALEFAKHGNLPPKLRAAYEANVGSYLRRAFLKYEDPSLLEKGKQFIAGSKPLRADSALFKSKKDLPDEVLEALGEIKEAGYPTAKSMAQLAKSVEDMKFFRSVADSPAFASKTAKEGFEQLPDTPRLGALRGMHVPKAIADDINEIVRPAKEGLEKALGKTVASFKYAKVIMNPATHIRNIMSNFILNSFEGMNPLDPRAQKAYAIAAKEVVRKGKWYKEAQKEGLGLNTFAAQEIRDLLVGPEISKLGRTTKESLNKLADIYQGEEEFAKMAQYIFQRQTKKLPPSEAWKVAERATFNYAQVTPFIRKIRESIFGYPFITFTYKATPQVVRTALTKPTRISNIGKIKEGIENLTNQEQLKEERAVEPEWIRNGFYLRLPGEDKYGRSKYLDLTYIMPFGDMVTGELFKRDIDQDTGFKTGPVRTATEKLAFVNMVVELAENQDFFGNKVFKESDPIEKQLGDIMLYLTRQFTPPLVGSTMPGGYRDDGGRKPSMFQRTADLESGGIERGGKQTRTKGQEVLRNVGLKINPFDVDTQTYYSDLNRRRALQTLLTEGGDLSAFEVLSESEEE